MRKLALWLLALCLGVGAFLPLRLETARASSEPRDPAASPAPPAEASQPGPPPTRRARPASARRPFCALPGECSVVGQSVGYPWRGRLRAGLWLSPSSALRHLEEEVPEGNFFGSRALVTLIRRSAEHVHGLAAGPRLGVGELSAESGGNIRGHRSHENGRDVDLGFYMLDGDGEGVELPQFLWVGRAGTAELDGEVYFFDRARNWLLVESLLRSREPVVQYVFVHRRIRGWLLDEARRQGASDAVLDRARRAILPPGEGRSPHRNHFHVRVYCTAHDGPTCRDRGPFWPWHEDPPPG